MDTFGYLGQGFGVALSPYNLVTALCGTLIGTVVGLLPGLGPINGVALLIPDRVRPGPAARVGLDPARGRVPGLRIRRPDQFDPAEHPG